MGKNILSEFRFSSNLLYEYNFHCAENIDVYQTKKRIDNATIKICMKHLQCISSKELRVERRFYVKMEIQTFYSKDRISTFTVAAGVQLLPPTAASKIKPRS